MAHSSASRRRCTQHLCRTGSMSYATYPSETAGTPNMPPKWMSRTAAALPGAATMYVASRTAASHMHPRLPFILMGDSSSCTNGASDMRPSISRHVPSSRPRMALRAFQTAFCERANP